MNVAVLAARNKIKFGTPVAANYSLSKFDGFTQTSAGVWKGNNGGHNIATDPTQLPAGCIHQATYTGAANQVAFIGLDAGSMPMESYPDLIDYTFYINTDGVYVAVRNDYAESSLLNTPAQAGDIFRLIRMNGQLKTQYFRNGIWNHHYLFLQGTNAMLYPKVGTYAINGVDKQINSPFITKQA